MRACLACGQANPAEARFCLACGTELAGAPERGTRKLVTVVFCDLVGSTTLGERLDPEAVRRLQQRYFDAMRRVLERHGGTVEKYVGDAVLAVFGVPELHEDDALRALRAAAEMRDALGTLNEELERTQGIRLELRIGVNTGEAVVGDAAARQSFATGDAVNVAARLEQAAAPGEILVGDLTRRLAAGSVELAPVAPLRAKGKSEPVAAWSLRSLGGPVPETCAPQAPLIGRSDELAALLDLVDDAFSSQAPRTISVLGAAGVGKSRLVAELVTTAAERARVLSGHCLPYGEGITYWPLAEVVREVAGDELVPGLAGALAGHPDAELVASRITAAIGGTAGGGSAQEAQWAVAELFAHLARRRPLLVVFDDIHWAEATFLDLIEYLERFLPAVPFVLICQARPELLERRPDWHATVTLAALGTEESTRLLESLGGGRLGDDEQARIVRTAEGNPLFVEQLLAMLEEGDGAPFELPPTIQALLGARVDRLPGAEREAIECGAVEGQTFHRDAVAELVGDPVGATVGTQLAELVRKELVRPARPAFAGGDGFRFGHLLVRDAVYSGITKEARAGFHEAYAGWLARVAGERLREVEEVLGYHLEQSYRYREELGIPDEHAVAVAEAAADRLGSAGLRAYARSDLGAAINLLDRALALGHGDAASRIEWLLDLSVALDYAGDARRGREASDAAVAAAEELGDMRLRLRAESQLGAVRFHTEPDASGREFARVLRSTAEACRCEGDHYGAATAWRRLGWVRQVEGRFAESVDLLERAIEQAEEAQHQRERGLAMAMLAISLWLGPTPVDVAVRRCREIQQVARGSLMLEVGTRASLAQLGAMRGDFEAVREDAWEAWTALAPHGEEHAIAQGSVSIGAFELLAGDAPAAEVALRGGYERLQAMGDTTFLAPIAALLAESLLRQGRLEEVQQHTAAAERAAAGDDFVTQAAWRGTRARLLARTGELAEAERLAAEAVELVERTDALVAHGDALCALAEVLGRSGRENEAAALCDRAVELYERKGNAVAAERARTELEPQQLR